MTPTLPGGKLGLASEAAIAALAMSGDDEAFAELVRRRQSSLRNMLRRLSRDPTLADDLAQQVFIKAWMSVRSLKSPLAFGAWLRTLAVNTWLAHVRASRRETSLDEDTLEVERALEGSTSDTTVPITERLDLDGALAQLVPTVRVCIVLAYSEGMSHSEISESTGIPLGTVKSHITRGGARLREILNVYGENHVARI